MNPQGGKGNSLGLTVGATNLTGTGDGHRPVIRPASVAVERGLTLTGFVDRVGDPIPIVAQDGSAHRPEILLTEALDEVARKAAMAPVSDVAVAVPAHWRAGMVDALRGALRSKPGLSRSPVVSDAAAAVTALRSYPGLPSAGVIALCDFGGSGSSITLIDAAAEDNPIGETIRVPDFSGDQIDQAILTSVVAGLFEASGADPAGTSMVGSLTRLREGCNRAKERLSHETATAIVVDVPGVETTVRMTRMELDDIIDGPLNDFITTLVDALERNRVPLASVSAIATIGGGARIPLITQRLSEHLRTTVISTPQPQLTAAQGAALIAQRSQIVETATAMAPAAPAPANVSAAAVSGAAPTVGALAWSEVDDDGPDDIFSTGTLFGGGYVATPADSRPEMHFQPDDSEEPSPSRSRRRGPALMAGLAAAAVLVGAAVFGLTALTRDTTAVPAGTSESIAPAPAPAAESPAPEVDAPAPAQATVVTTVAARPQQQVAPHQQAQAPAEQPAAVEQHAPVVEPAPQAPAPEPAPPAPAPAPASPAPAPESPAPAPQSPAPAPAPQNPAPPVDPGTGSGTGTGTGTSTGGTGTGTGTGSSGTGTGTGGTGAEPSTGTGGTEKVPAKPGPLAPILDPLLVPSP